MYHAWLHRFCKIANARQTQLDTVLNASRQDNIQANSTGMATMDNVRLWLEKELEAIDEDERLYMTIYDYAKNAKIARTNGLS